jgi:signal transduction histidine kinase
MPVIVNDHVAGVIYTSRTPRNIFDHLYQERAKFVLAGFAVALGTIVIGLIFSRTITRPMYELIDRAIRIGQGDREAFRPLSHYGTREFALLSRNFLDMAGQLARRSDYIASFSAHLTHELKSPLTSIKGAAELLLDPLKTGSEGLTRSEQESLLSNILSDASRLEAIAQRLRELARAETIDQRESTELASVIENLRDRFPALKLETSGTLDQAVGMSAEKTLIVLSHLADNALRHHAKAVRLAVMSEDAGVRIEVSNDGDPISEQNRDRIFDAFFTTRRESGGTGMGLAIARSVMTSRGGSITLRPATDGVTFELRFPAG